MGTSNKNLEIYKKLWIEFERLLKKEGLNLSSFAKKWEKFHNEDNDEYNKVHDKLKHWKRNKDSAKIIYTSKLEQLEKYVKFLNNGFTVLELQNIGYDKWFED